MFIRSFRDPSMKPQAHSSSFLPAVICGAVVSRYCINSCRVKIAGGLPFQLDPGSFLGIGLLSLRLGRIV